MEVLDEENDSYRKNVLTYPQLQVIRHVANLLAITSGKCGVETN